MPKDNMGASLSFQFVDEKLNQRLAALFDKHKIAYSVDEKGALHYAPEDEEFIENNVIASIRDQIFPIWQVLSCPRDWSERYRDYMTRQNVPFIEERIDGQLCFLLPRRYRPHSWKLAAAGATR